MSVVIKLQPTDKAAPVCGIVVHATADDLHAAIYDALEAMMYGQCDDCDEWFPEVELRTLKTVERADTLHCEDCYAESIQPHPQDCRCETCKAARETRDDARFEGFRCGEDC